MPQPNVRDCQVEVNLMAVLCITNGCEEHHKNLLDHDRIKGGGHWRSFESTV